jgi:hypothetical protein
MQGGVLVKNTTNETKHVENLDVDGGKCLLKRLTSDYVLVCRGLRKVQVTSPRTQSYKILSSI